MVRILFICLFLIPSVSFAQFNPNNFKPIKPIEEVSEPVNDIATSVLLDTIQKLEKEIQDLKDRVASLEANLADQFTDLDKKDPVTPSYTGFVTMYSLPDNQCSACVIWKNDINNTYRKAFEKAGYFVNVNPDMSDPYHKNMKSNAKAFPYFVVERNGVKKWFQGLITPSFVENNW